MDIVAGPGHIRAAFPDRFAAVHAQCAFLTKQNTPCLIGIASHVAGVPPWGVIGVDAELCEAIQVCVILDLQVGAGDLHTVLVTQCLSGHLHAVQHVPGRTLTHGVQMKIQPRLVKP